MGQSALNRRPTVRDDNSRYLSALIRLDANELAAANIFLLKYWKFAAQSANFSDMCIRCGCL
jgi:hypothetical protein